MSRTPKVSFIGAGSTVFVQNLVGDILLKEALQPIEIALMDIDAQRLRDARGRVEKMIASLGLEATVSSHADQRAAIDGADFVIVAFQIGGYDPCTLTDFAVPKRYGLRQTIGDTLGIGGIMRALRTVPCLWSLCADMQALCPDAILLQYVNPMAINCWAIAERYPEVRTVGLCHSVQGTIAELAHDLDLPVEAIRYRCAGINHMAFFTELQSVDRQGRVQDLYPLLRDAYRDGRVPKPNQWNPRCPNRVRYEVMMHLGYFVTESSEHFAEYVPWFIKSTRPDLLDTFAIPLDEYPARCREQIEAWENQSDGGDAAEQVEIIPTHEYAAAILNSVWTDAPSTIWGNVPNRGLMPQLPEGCCVEVPCTIRSDGVHPQSVAPLPPQLTALMRTNINVQELTVRALLEESREHVYHAAMLDPRTAAELDLQAIRSLVDDLITAHDNWMPAWLRS